MRRVEELKGRRDLLPVLAPEFVLSVAAVLIFQSLPAHHSLATINPVQVSYRNWLSSWTAPSPRDAGPNTSQLGQRIVGGNVTRNDNGVIVVEPLNSSGNFSTSLTADAVITSSLIAKISSDPRLRASEFEIKANNGIVVIRARVPSLEDAVTVINFALSVDDVRQIVYQMPQTT
jgi:hypothetical protein